MAGHDVDSDPGAGTITFELLFAGFFFYLARNQWGCSVEQALMVVGAAFIVWNWISQAPIPESPLAQTSGYAIALMRPPAQQGSGGQVDGAMALMRAKIEEAQASVPFYGLMNCPPPRDEGSIAPF